MTGGSSVWMVAFIGSNWAIWKARMEDFLCCKDLQGPLLGDGAKPEKMSMEEWRILDRKTVGYIRKWIFDNVYHNVAKRRQLILYGRSWRSSTRPRMQKTKPS